MQQIKIINKANTWFFEKIRKLIKHLLDKSRNKMIETQEYKWKK